MAFLPPCRILARLQARIRARKAVPFLAALLWVIPTAAVSHENIAKAAVTAADAPQVDKLTENLLSAADQYRGASRAHRGGLAEALVAAAASRARVLAALMESDPGAVLDAALTAAVRAEMPAFLGQHLEQAENLAGALTILHEDRGGGESRFHYLLESPRGRYSLHFAGDPPEHLRTGAQVHVTGVRLGQMLAVGAHEADFQAVADAAPASSLGARHTIVVLVNFADAPTLQPYTAAAAQSALFGTTSSFFLENSYQQTWLTGDIVGWFTIALPSTVCDYATLATQARAAATAAGVDLTSYAHQVFAFPQNACGWWGLSTVGGNPSQSWINGDFELGVLAHELGHGLGLWHAHALDCGTTTVVGSSCATNEYGDIVDMMGGSESAHYNAFQKERLGWLGAGAAPLLTTVVADGTYAIDAYEPMGAGPKALKILKSTDSSTGKRTWYYVESRQATGFDSFLADPRTGAQNVTSGVLVHTGSEASGNTSFLLDMTPATPVYYYWYDPALAAGQTFIDPDTGMTIASSSVSATGAAVTVRVAAASTSPVAVSVSTDQPSYTRGQSASITARVTSGGSPVANAAVKFTIIKASGSVVTAKATTTGSGMAVYKLRLKTQDPVGLYTVDASTTANGNSVKGAATFTVR